MKLTRWMALALLGLMIAAAAQAEPVKIYTGTIGSDQYQWGTASPAGPADDWSAFDTMPAPVMDNMVCSDGRYIYALGGYSTGAGLNTLRRYDPLRKIWTALANLPVDLSSTTAAVVGDTLYVTGGWTANMTVEMDTLFKYSISTDTWVGAPPNHSGNNWFPKLVSCKGKLFVIGGNPTAGANAPSQQVWIYTPGAGWALGDSLNTGRVFTQAVVYHDTIWVAGGVTDAGAITNTEFYDPATGQWVVDAVTFPPMPIGIGAAAQGLACDQFVIFSGIDTNWALGVNCQYFDLMTKTWLTAEAISATRYRVDGVGYLNRAAFAMGGSSGGFTPTNAVQYKNLGPSPDAAVLQIVNPKFPTYPADAVISTTVRVANLGDAPATVPVRLELANQGVGILNTVSNCDLAAFHDTTITFTSGGVGPVGGQFCSQYTTELPGDADPGNDQSIRFFSVSEWQAAPQNAPYGIVGYSTGYGIAPNGHPTVYQIGGRNSTGFIDSCMGYDLTDNAWVNYGHLPGAVGYGASATCNGKIYLMGSWTPSNNNYIFDIATSTASSGAAVPMPVQSPSAAVYKGSHIYLLGGANTASWTAVNYVQVYDINANTWSQATPLPAARLGGAAACIDGKYLVYSMGRSGVPRSNTWVGEIDPYDPTVIVWQEKSPCPAGGGYRVASTTLDNALFTAGGWDSLNTSHRTVTLVYNPEFDAWLSLAAKTTGMSNIACAVGPNGIYVPGGYNGSYLSTFEIYTMMPHMLGVQEQPTDKPLAYKLTLGVNPNPCNSRATISFQIPKTGLAELAVYNITGQKVRTLLSGRLMAGKHGFVWDGLNENGKPVASGSYLAVLKADGKQASQRLVLIK